MTINFPSLSRQDLHEIACDAIAAAGHKPSLSSVRDWTLTNAGMKKGSDGDTQRDINAWFSRLLTLKNQPALPGVPDTIAVLFSDVWQKAHAAAVDGLAAEREALAIEKAAAERQIAQAQADCKRIAQQMAEVKIQLDLMAERLSGRDQIILQLETQLAEHRATTAAKEERIHALMEEIARLDSAQKARIAAFADIERRAEERLAAAERRALLEIDKAREAERELRARLKTVEDSTRREVDGYRMKASDAQMELSASRGRSDRLAEEIAAYSHRIIELEGALAQAKTALTALPLPAPQRSGRGLNTRGPRTKIPRKKAINR